MGFLFLVVYSRRAFPPAAPHAHQQLAHTQLVHTQLPHIQLTHTQLAHTQLAHTQLAHTQLTHKQLGHTPSLCVASVALGDIDRHFAWQACTLYGTGLALVARLGRSGRPLSPRLLAWQAWHLVTSTVTLRGRRGTECHLVTSTVTLRGRRGTYGTGLGLARLGRSGRPLSPRLLVWQAWHLVLSAVALRGRRGT